MMLYFLLPIVFNCALRPNGPFDLTLYLWFWCCQARCECALLTLSSRGLREPAADRCVVFLSNSCWFDCLCCSFWDIVADVVTSHWNRSFQSSLPSYGREWYTMSPRGCGGVDGRGGLFFEQRLRAPPHRGIFLPSLPEAGDVGECKQTERSTPTPAEDPCIFSIINTLGLEVGIWRAVHIWR